MSGFVNQQEYHEHIRSLGPLPRGFRSNSTSLTFLPRERPSAEPYRMDISAIILDEPTPSFAGVFTRNAVPGAPVLIARERLNSETMQGVLINNRISNVAASGGMETAGRLAARASGLLGIGSAALFPSSTGIIGWALPEEEMTAALPALMDGLGRDNVLDLARGIMTTDSYPKVRVKTLGGGRIVGIAKGAGMIEPNMATMLSFIMTDIDISREDLRSLLTGSVEDSFNAISVDSDQSTSDMVLAFSSRKIRVELDEFRSAFAELCRELSLDIVRNGEGTGHVIEISVGGHPDARFCRALAKSVGNSPLVKTAVYGNDPNVGRILSALGDCAGNLGRKLNTGSMTISIGGREVFSQGVFRLDRDKEAVLAGYLAENSQNPRINGYPQNDRRVEISVDLGESGGTSSAGGSSEGSFQRIFASDLGHEYVSENADYRT